MMEERQRNNLLGSEEGTSRKKKATTRDSPWQKENGNESVHIPNYTLLNPLFQGKMASRVSLRDVQQPEQDGNGKQRAKKAQH